MGSAFIIILKFTFFFSNFLFSVIVFESYICWINKLHCYTEVSYLTIGLSFPPFFCWSIPQRFTKLYNSKYILHSLILDFFQALLPQNTCLVFQCFITFSNLNPKSPCFCPTLTKHNLSSNYPRNTCRRLLSYHSKCMMSKLFHCLKLSLSKIKMYGEWP